MDKGVKQFCKAKHVADDYHPADDQRGCNKIPLIGGLARYVRSHPVRAKGRREREKLQLVEIYLTFLFRIRSAQQMNNKAAEYEVRDKERLTCFAHNTARD